MGRKQEGTVVERPTKKGITYALRFIAYGERQYITLGTDRDGMDRERAEIELDNIMADVRRGLWIPPQPKDDKSQVADGATTLPTFGEFARKRLVARKLEVDQR